MKDSYTRVSATYGTDVPSDARSRSARILSRPDGIRALSVALLAVVPWIAHAQQTTLYTEYDKTIQSANTMAPLARDAFGEQISLYTGAVEFDVTDVSLPGNSSLPVSVGRRFVVEDKLGTYLPGTSKRQLGDWVLDVPKLTGVFPRSLGWVSRIAGDGTFPNGARRCSIPRTQPELAAPPLTPDAQTGLTWFAAGEFWHGNSLHIPGHGSQEMMIIHPSNTQVPSVGGPYYWMTKDQWFFSCSPSTANGVAGESFVAKSPDGTTYKFNWFANYGALQVNKPHGMMPLDPPVNTQSLTAGSSVNPVLPRPVASLASGAFLRRYEVNIYATEVQDRFGNKVVYTYDPARPNNLMRVEGFGPTGISDGRRIDLTYNATTGLVETIVADGRTWRYVYADGLLTEVNLPDQSKWQYNFGGLASVHIATGIVEPTGCWSPNVMDPTQSTYVGSVTHPSGATAEFTFKPRVHSRSNVPPDNSNCFLVSDGNGNVSYYAYTPPMYGAVSIQSRIVSGPGLPSQQWSYLYSAPVDCSSGQPCPSTKTVDIVGPSSWERQTFSTRYRDGEGLLLKIERGSSAADVLSTQAFQYLTNPSGQAFLSRMAISPFARGDGASERYAPLYDQTTTQQGRTFSWRVATDCGGTYCFDSFARPTKVTKASGP